MALLDSLLQIFAWLSIIGPIVFLVIGLLAFYYKPKHRFSVGIAWITLGLFGLSVFSFSLVASFVMPFSAGAFALIVLMLIVEILTVATGIVSLIRRNKEIRSN
jgi:hypothetical protein